MKRYRRVGSLVFGLLVQRWQISDRVFYVWASAAPGCLAIWRWLARRSLAGRTQLLSSPKPTFDVFVSLTWSVFSQTIHVPALWEVEMRIFRAMSGEPLQPNSHRE